MSEEEIILELNEKEATIKQLQEENTNLFNHCAAKHDENQGLKRLLREWIDQFGYPGKSLTNDTLNAIKQNP